MFFARVFAGKMLNRCRRGGKIRRVTAQYWRLQQSSGTVMVAAVIKGTTHGVFPLALFIF